MSVERTKMNRVRKLEVQMQDSGGFVAWFAAAK